MLISSISQQNTMTRNIELPMFYKIVKNVAEEDNQLVLTCIMYNDVEILNIKAKRRTHICSFYEEKGI